MRFLDEKLVELGVVVKTPQEAIRRAGFLLVQEGIIKEEYVLAMVDSYEKQGPYIVLAPGIAMPHARPEMGVNSPGVSLVQLATPVEFGHSSNDPVYLVVALAGSTSEEHVGILHRLSLVLGNQDQVDVLKRAVSYKEVQKIVEGLV